MNDDSNDDSLPPWGDCMPLMQDEAEGRGLSRALASKPDAPLHAREAVGALAGMVRAKIIAETQPGGLLHQPGALKPCRSPYCECESGKCTIPGFFDARGTTAQCFTEDESLHLNQAVGYLRDYGLEQARLGNNSIANGCDASAFVLRRMLFPDAAAPAATDAALDLVELPPIRVDTATYEALKALGLQRGLILQPLVREAIQRMLAQPGRLTDPQVATILAQHRAPPTNDGAKLHDWAMGVVSTVAATLAPPSRTDAEIVDQTDQLALKLMSEFHDREPASADVKCRDSKDPRAVHCWRVACVIQEMLTQTDPENAVAQLEPTSYVHIHVDQHDKLECCRRLLEMIAKGECDDAAAAAKQELIAHGFWPEGDS